MLHDLKFRLPYLVLLTIAVSGCAATPTLNEVIVPSLNPEHSGRALTGKFVWYDLFTQDMDAAVKFYQGLFGWTFTDTTVSDAPVKTIARDGVPIANAVEIDPQKKDDNESLWLGYISVPDVDQATAAIEDHGGVLYRQAKDLPDRGRIAIAIDGQGAIFGLVHSSSGDPPDPEVFTNRFIGSELWTTDLDRAIDFYTMLAAYEPKIVTVGKDRKYHLLQRDNIPRAGVVQILWDDVKPNWIPYVGVGDLGSTIEKVKALGGSLLIEPPKETRNNPLAIIADPSGAVLGIQQVPVSGATGRDLP